MKIQLKVQLGVTSGRPKSIDTTGHSDDSMTQRLKAVKSVRFQRAVEPLLKTSIGRDKTDDLKSISKLLRQKMLQ